MRIHSLEHQAEEGPARITQWALSRGHALARTALFAGEPLPDLEAFDLLVVMGGGMNIYQHRDHPWLVAEKEFLRRAIAAQKPILGLCLGAQLLADVLGARVYQNPVKEIGWFPIEILDRDAPFASFPERLTVMHWHGDTFELPPGARLVAQSVACASQAFVFGDRVVGLQFHLEFEKIVSTEMVDACAAELVPAQFVQSREEIFENAPDLAPAHAALDGLLDVLIAKAAIS